MNYKDVIESRYNRKNWLLLLRDIFGNKAKFWSTPYVVETDSQMARQALWLGTISLSDEQTIAIYEVELAESVDIERNRRGIRDMLLTQWRNNGNAGAFMFCYRENESVLRFSYVSESWKFADDGTYQKESTDTRRFTYLLGEGHRSRTAIQQFETLKGSAQTLKDLTKAFSVDAVSDMFFRDYKAQYANIIFYITGKRMVKKGNKWEEIKEGRACRKILDEFSEFADPEKAVRDYVKKLMGRLVFLQFLQKKGWLGVPLNEEWGSGDKEFIQNLFAKTRDKDNFIDDVLEVLFNDLNTERKNDISQFSIFNYQFKIPYLNGGLFERDATDETRFPLPAKYMEDMLEFFSRYNFTIDENDPNDAEVGVDPEMLGRIFENLLEDNKDKGAFYTPKEIVQYMCRESLIAYLQTDQNEEYKENIRQFVTTHNAELLGSIKLEIDQKLKDVKICDPAIGSGAFPMGLLKELYLCRSAIEGLDDDNASEIKKHIIQHNIYGVDIEKGAVDIARLRFWLSLIVDEKTPHALPNLDFKIMQGNSLLEQYKGVDLSAMTQEKNERGKNYQTTMFDDMLDVYRRELREMLNEYYQCTDHKEKKTLRKRIIDNVKKQLREQSINIDFGDLDLSGNDQFFLWHTWFHDVFSQGGFDIVIGNPPYGANIDNDIETYKKKYRSLIKNYADIYKMFIGEGINILRSNATLCLITPNTFLSQPRYKDIRAFILNYNLYRVVNLGMGVFGSAVVPVCISLIENRKSKGYYQYLDARDIKNWYNIHCLYEQIFIDNIIKQKDLNLMPSSNDDALTFNDVFDIRDAGIQYHRSNIGLKNKGGNDLYERLFNKNKKYFSESHPVWYGKLINRYYCSPKTDEYFNIDYKSVLKSNEQVSFNREAFSRKEKIVWRQTAPCIVATLDSNFLWFRNTIQCAWIRAEYVGKISMLASLAIFNSKYIRYQYNKLVQESGRVFPQVKLTHLKKLPLVIPNKSMDDNLKSNAKKILSLKEKDFTYDTSAIESEIDKLVYQLYGLTEEEIAIIENQ